MIKGARVSIITVVFNSREFIARTIRSVAAQTYDNIEYIIIDGESTDGTLEVIRDFREVDVLISEADQGLYDAMNKGLSKATGDYVWFLNSGDEIFSPDTLEQVFRGLDRWPDVIYGGTLIVDSSGKEIGDRRLRPPENLSWKSFRRGMIVCHQSLIIRRGLAPSYNLQYQLAADIDWAIRATKGAADIHYASLTLSRFMEGGLSGQHIKKGLKERFRIMAQYYGTVPTVLRHILFGVRLGWFYAKNRRI